MQLLSGSNKGMLVGWSTPGLLCERDRHLSLPRHSLFTLGREWDAPGFPSQDVN